jgi:ADP-ribosylglycohydrolase
VQAVQSFGSSCHLPGSFQGPVLTALFAPNYTEAVRANILAGGDQGSRSLTLGAIVAAAGGLAVVPKEWKDKTNKMMEIEALVDELLKQRFSEGMEE